MEKQIFTAIHNLRRRYNLSPASPINRLLPELLGAVFDYLRDPVIVPSPEQLQASIFGSYRPLISAMLVCRRWTAVALKKSSLWTEVDYFNDAPAAPHLLKRSRIAPIHLRISTGKISSSRGVESLRGYCTRLRRLDLFVHLSPQTTKVGEVLELDMPLLEGLVVNNSTRSVSTAISDGVSGRFPSLKGVVVRGILWIPQSPLRSLTHLHISRFDVQVEIMLRLLAKFAPGLRVLDIREWNVMVEQLMESDTPGLDTVTLPTLEHLSVRDVPTATALSILSHLDLPRVAILDFKFLGNDPTLRLPPSTHQRQIPRAGHRLYLKDSARRFHVQLNGDRDSLSLALTPSPASSQPFRSPTLDQDSFPLTNVKEFRVGSGRRGYLLLPVHTPFLTRLVVEILDAVPMISVLADVLEACAPGHCPHLTSIDIRTPLYGFPWPRFLRAFAARDRSGVRIKLLRISTSTWDDHACQSLSEFRKYVDCVVAMEGGPGDWDRGDRIWEGKDNIYWKDVDEASRVPAQVEAPCFVVHTFVNDSDSDSD